MIKKWESCVWAALFIISLANVAQSLSWLNGMGPVHKDWNWGSQRAEQNVQLHAYGGTWVWAFNDPGKLSNDKSKLKVGRSRVRPSNWFNNATYVGEFYEAYETTLGTPIKPSIATNQQEIWVIAFSAYVSGSTTEGDYDIFMIRSTNDGVTWSAATALDNRASSEIALDLAPVLLFEPSERKYWCTWLSSQTHSGNNGDPDIAVASSTDDTGATWSDAVWANLDCCAGPNNQWEREKNLRMFLGSPAGTIHISFASLYLQYIHEDFANYSSYDIAVITKEAGSSTWGHARGLNSEQGSRSSNVSIEEDDVAVASDGNTVVFLYIRRFQPTWQLDLMVSVSRDGGWTFSDPIIIEGNIGVQSGLSATTDGRGMFAIFWPTTRMFYTLPGTTQNVQIGRGTDMEIFHSIVTFNDETAASAQYTIPAPVDMANMLIPNPITNNGDNKGASAFVDQSTGDGALMFISNKHNFMLNGEIMYGVGQDNGVNDVNVYASSWINRFEDLCRVNSPTLPVYCHTTLRQQIARAPVDADEFTEILIAVNEGVTPITIGDGKKIRISPAYSTNNVMEIPDTQPAFIIVDSTVELEYLSSGFHHSRGSFLVRNDGGSDHLVVTTGSFQGHDCPLGFLRPASPADPCVPCPKGNVCADRDMSTPTSICSVGRFCPMTTFDDSMFKCNMYHHYSTGGFEAKSDCIDQGEPCIVGYYCPPGALTSQHSPLINVSRTSFDETVVFPATSVVDFTVTTMANPLFATPVRLELYDDRNSDANFPKWLEVTGDLDVKTGGEDALLSATLKSKVEGVSISETLRHTYLLRYRSSTTMEELGAPLKIDFSRTVTTVVFNPEEGISDHVSIYSEPFTKELLIFNIGCESSLNWTARVINCTHPSEPLDWASTDDAQGHIALGSIDPAIIRVNINFTQSILPGGQLNALITKDTDESSGEPDSLLGSKGFFAAGACVDVRFRLIGLNNTQDALLSKLSPVKITMFETCPAGRYSATGNSEDGACDLCPIGTYSEDRGAAQCRSCPENLPRTVPGAASVDECMTAPGTFLDTDGKVFRCDTLGDGVECLQEGTRLQSLQIKPGFWRSWNGSRSVLKCINQNFCKGSSLAANVNSNNNTGQRRLSISHRFLAAQIELSNEYCIEHHLGPLCEGCEDGYVRRGLSTCQICDEAAIAGDRMRLGWTIFAGVLILLIAFLVVQWNAIIKFVRNRRESVIAVNRRLSTLAFASNKPGAIASNQINPEKRRSKRKAMEMVRTMSVRLRAKTKLDKRLNLLWSVVVSIEANTTLRILLSLFQVTNGVSHTFYDLLPPPFHDITAAFNIVSAELFYRIDFGCIVHSNHNLSLILSMTAPAIFTTLIIIIHLIIERRLRAQRRLSDVPKLRNGSFSIFLVLLFLIYPGVSNTVLSTFACREFDGGLRYLRKDLTVSCDAPDRQVWNALAGVGIIVYVIGIPLFYAGALFRVRKYLNPKDGEKPDPANFPSVLFLVSIYKPKYYWWEVFELVRKLIQTSLVVFIVDGSLFQAIFMVTFTMCVVILLNELKPYVSGTANRLAYVAQWQILLISFFTLLYRVDLNSIDKNVNYDKKTLLDTCVIASCFIAPSLALYQSRKSLFKFAAFVWNKFQKNCCCGPCRRRETFGENTDNRFSVGSKVFEGDDAVDIESLGGSKRDSSAASKD